MRWGGAPKPGLHPRPAVPGAGLRRAAGGRLLPLLSSLSPPPAPARRRGLRRRQGCFVRGGEVSVAAPSSPVSVPESREGVNNPRHGGRHPSSPSSAACPSDAGRALVGAAEGTRGGRSRPPRAVSRPCSSGEAGAGGCPRAGCGAGAVPPLPAARAETAGARGCLGAARTRVLNVSLLNARSLFRPPRRDFANCCKTQRLSGPRRL